MAREFVFKAILMLVAACLAGSQAVCQESPATNPCQHFPVVEDPSKFGDDFDWENGSPFDFLDLLRTEPTFLPCTVAGCHEEWIKEQHLEPLIALLYSDEPCTAVVSVSSSYLGEGQSTVGDLAAFLILSYRAGYFPSALNSPTDPDKQEILEWWWNHRLDSERDN